MDDLVVSLQTYESDLPKTSCKDTNRNEPNCVGFARERAQTMSFVRSEERRVGKEC